MKLVIIMQAEESCVTRWRPKFADTFIVENVSFNQRQTIQRFGIPFLTKLLECGMDITMDQVANAERDCGHADAYWREYVKHYVLVEDDVDLVEAGLINSWEHPWTLTYVKERKQWTANRWVANGEMSGWQTAPSGNEYEGKWEGYALAEGGQRVEGSYNVHYVERQVA